MTWYFRLEGDDLDLRALESLFRGTSNLGTLEDGGRYIVLEPPFPSAEARAALDTAEDLLLLKNRL